MIDANIVPDTFETTATYMKGTEIFNHFGIHPMTASLYGDRKEDIKQVVCTVDKSSVWSDRMKKDVQEYWGYFDAEQGKFGLIYQSAIQLYICFPSGIDTLQERDLGRAFKLNIVIKNG